MIDKGLNRDSIQLFLSSADWKTTFSNSHLAAGYKIARAKQVTSCLIEELDTGDIEITASVMERSGHQEEATIALWQEGSVMQLDASCSCSVGVCCQHAAATLEHLTRPGRLESAYGEITEQPPTKTLHQQAAPTTTPPSPSLTSQSDSNSEAKVSFQLHIEKRPQGTNFNWLPDVYATAHAIYNKDKYPLDPAGNIRKPRQRASEMTALQTLYALDLLPGAEQPPPSLKKLSSPHQDGTLWSPDHKQWQPSLYWQRFHHEAITALEKRGWQVTIAAGAIHPPLKFEASSWRAEFIDEGRGWFSLSAGFEVDGQAMDLQPILATLVEYNFLELTEGMPDGQEFLVFLTGGEHAGRGITLPVGRFRRILKHLGELMDFNFNGKAVKLHKIEAASLSEILSEEDPEFLLPKEIEALRNSSLKQEQVSVPDTLKATLRSYQREGYEWMQFLASHGLHGVLADDMGLGKTMQTLTHILAEKQKGNTLPNLVVAPTSVVENWQREAAQFAPSLKVTILQGADRHRRFSDLSWHRYCAHLLRPAAP